ncbi:MAG: PUR family DNA/RNA-binding protein [Bacteroidales bacterium]|nr:PUR family DNA/RNA-binding protein [Bacteroidales bacterium]
MEESMTDGAKKFRENVFTSSVRAGKRTYYFDVKETKGGEKYITVTERKRRYNEDGSYKVEKHKIFLYKEDFDKFADALDDVIEFVESGKLPKKTE